MDSILILGGGFAGLTAAKKIAARLGRGEPRITLIDRHTYHLYTPDLYEVATAAKASGMRRTVTAPFSQALAGTGVEFVHDTVAEIDIKKNIVRTEKNGELSFSYLAITLGSIPNFYNIPGMQEHAYSFKKLEDATRINEKVHELCSEYKKKGGTYSVVIGGGGATGVELACELAGCIKKLCGLKASREAFRISLVEASPFLCASGVRGTEIITKRCAALGIDVRQETSLADVQEKEISLIHGGKKTTISYDLLIWTGGVQAHPLMRKTFTNVGKSGGCMVDEYLAVPSAPHIYVAGDSACITNPATGKPVPLLAQTALKQAEVIAHNIVAATRGTRRMKYVPRVKGVILPLGGRHAVWNMGNNFFRGAWVWALRRGIDLWYWVSVVGPLNGLRKWWHDTSAFIKND